MKFAPGAIPSIRDHSIVLEPTAPEVVLLEVIEA
jgi:hypothetical protein